MTTGCYKWMLVLSLALGHGVALAQQENWTLGADQGADPGCYLVTPTLALDDGHGETHVQLKLDERRLQVITASNIDSEFNDIALQVDTTDVVPADRIDNETDVVFESRIEQITQTFIAGNRVRLNLRFWPTWPTTGVKTAEFSLAGFTRAYRRLARCN